MIHSYHSKVSNAPDGQIATADELLRCLIIAFCNYSLWSVDGMILLSAVGGRKPTC